METALEQRADELRKWKLLRASRTLSKIQNRSPRSEVRQLHTPATPTRRSGVESDSPTRRESGWLPPWHRGTQDNTSLSSDDKKLNLYSRRTEMGSLPCPANHTAVRNGKVLVADDQSIREEAWLAKRLSTRRSVDTMGLSSAWLKGKNRSSIENRALHSIDSKRAFVMNTKEYTHKATDISPRGPGTRYLKCRVYEPPTQLVPEDAEDKFDLHNINRTERSVSDDAAFRLLRAFIRSNKYQLSYIFLVSGITDDYRLSLEDAAMMLERAGRLVPLGGPTKFAMEYGTFKKIKGTLRPITCHQLRLVLETEFPFDKHHLIDYRLILEDFVNQDILHYATQNEKILHQQLSHPDHGTKDAWMKTVHYKIGADIAQGQSAYKWTRAPNVRRSPSR